MSQQSSLHSEPTVSMEDSFAKVFGKEHSGRVRGIGFGPTPSSVFGLPTPQLGVSLESSRGGLSQSQMGQRVQHLESDLQSERLKRHLVETELQNELQKERDKRMAMEGAIAAAFEQYFGKVPEAIANLMSTSSKVNMFFIFYKCYSNYMAITTLLFLSFLSV